MPGERFPKNARIRRRADFDRVFAARLQVAGRYLKMHLAPAAADGARLGFAISRRSLPLAHERNRLKRMLREDFRKARHRLPPLDIVVSLRQRDCPELRILREEARSLFLRLDELKPLPSPRDPVALHSSPDATPKPGSETPA